MDKSLEELTDILNGLVSQLRSLDTRPEAEVLHHSYINALLADQLVKKKTDLINAVFKDRTIPETLILFKIAEENLLRAYNKQQNQESQGHGKTQGKASQETKAKSPKAH